MATAGTKHPNYILIWVYLAVLTGVELLVALLQFLPRRLLIGALIFLAIWKAMLVALYFMHLKFEPKRLLIIVLAPLPLAVILVLYVMQEF
jgi:cytochrome c oxidase subunit 4